VLFYGKEDNLVLFYGKEAMKEKGEKVDLLYETRKGISDLLHNLRECS